MVTFQGLIKFAELWPVLQPSVPSLEDRVLSIVVNNPFAGDGSLEHPGIRTKVALLVLPEDGAVNGLIKFRLRAVIRQRALVQPQVRLFLRRDSSSGSDLSEKTVHAPHEWEPGYLPPDFS